MALGAITPQVSSPYGATSPQVEGVVKYSITNVVLDSSYPTGGSPLTPAQLGLPGGIVFALVSTIVPGAGGVTALYYNPATSKLQAFAGAAEVANTTSLAAVTAQVVAFGWAL